MRKILIIGTLLLFAITGCSKEATSQVNNLKTETKHSVEVFGTIRALDAKNTMLDFPATIEIVPWILPLITKMIFCGLTLTWMYRLT